MDARDRILAHTLWVHGRLPGEWMRRTRSTRWGRRRQWNWDITIHQQCLWHYFPHLLFLSFSWIIIIITSLLSWTVKSPPPASGLMATAPSITDEADDRPLSLESNHLANWIYIFLAPLSRWSSVSASWLAHSPQWFLFTLWATCTNWEDDSATVNLVEHKEETVDWGVCPLTGTGGWEWDTIWMRNGRQLNWQWRGALWRKVSNKISVRYSADPNVCARPEFVIGSMGD